MCLEKFERKIKQLVRVRDTQKEMLRASKNALKEAEHVLENTLEAQTIAQQVAQQVQQQVHNRIAGVVSLCLTVIFDDPYEFKVEFERKRGQTEAKISFERDGNKLDPMTSAGGGVVDVASFALRIACLMLSRPKLRPVVIMDEPFKFLSEEHRPRVRILLEKLSEDMGIQFIMVTHIKELVTGKVIEIEGEDNEKDQTK